jgi:hypothetical protein
MAAKRASARSSGPRRSKKKRPERRANDRRPIDLLVNRFLDGYPYLCRATDISHSGMRLRPLLGPTVTSALGRPGPMFMGLQFQLPGSQDVLTASGEAVFVDGEEGPVGVRFTRVPTGTALSLARFLAASRA